MATRGFLIRFIDIGLIVLFGFLGISDIEVSSRVELNPGSERLEESPTEVDERVFLAVEIGPDNRFAVVDVQARELVSEGLTTNRELAAELGRIDAAHRAEGLETVVLITPHPDSPVQRTVDVMDVCDRLSLSKSLQVDLDGRARAPEPGGNR